MPIADQHPIDDTYLKMLIFDDISQAEQRAFNLDKYRGANGVIITCDVTNQKSFDNVTNWIEEVKRYAREGTPIILAATKCDRLSEADKSTVQQKLSKLEKDTGIEVHTTSAKNNDGIDKLFLDCAEKAYAYQQPKIKPAMQVQGIKP